MTAKKPSDSITASNYPPAKTFINSIGVSQFRVTKYLEIADSLRPRGLTITDQNIAEAVDSEWSKGNGKLAMAPLVKAGLFRVLPLVTDLGQEYAFTKEGRKAVTDLKTLKDNYDAQVESKKKSRQEVIKVGKSTEVKVDKPSPVSVPPAKVEQVTDDTQELRKIIEQLVSTVEKQAESMDAMAQELFRLGKLWSE